MILTNTALTYSTHIAKEVDSFNQYLNRETGPLTSFNLRVQNVLRLILEHMELTRHLPPDQQLSLLHTIERLQVEIKQSENCIEELLTTIFELFEKQILNVEDPFDDFVYLFESIEEEFVYLSDDKLEFADGSEISLSERASCAESFLDESLEMSQIFPNAADALADYEQKLNNFKGAIFIGQEQDILSMLADAELLKFDKAVYAKGGQKISAQCLIDLLRFSCLRVNGEILKCRESEIAVNAEPEDFFKKIQCLLALNDQAAYQFSTLLTQATFAHLYQILASKFNRLDDDIYVKQTLKSEVEIMVTPLSYMHIYFRAWFPIVSIDNPSKTRYIACQRYFKIKKGDSGLRGCLVEDLYSPSFESKEQALTCSFNSLRKKIKSLYP